MMNTLLIHMGLPKTGTKSLQKCLHYSHKDLLKYNILYPISENIFYNTKHTHEAMAYKFDSVFSFIKENLDKYHIVISSESITGWLVRFSRVEIQERLNKLKSLNGNVKFIISVRNYEEWLISFLRNCFYSNGIQNISKKSWIEMLKIHAEKFNELFELIQNNFEIKIIPSDSKKDNLIIEEFGNLFVDLSNNNQAKSDFLNNYEITGKIHESKQWTVFHYCIAPTVKNLIVNLENLYLHDIKIHDIILSLNRKYCQLLKNDEFIDDLIEKYLNSIINEFTKNSVDEIALFRKNLNI